MSIAMILGFAALGGGVGAAVRYAVDDWVSARWRREFPLGILLVNVTGSLLIGLVTGSAVAATGAGWTALIGTGVLGGYTTFSTASLDTIRLARAGRCGMALGYAVGTMLATVCAAMSGLWLGDCAMSG